MEDCQNDTASKYGYIYTALNPSLVSHCTTGSFLGPGQTNLIIAKNAYLEVYSLEKNQLQLQCQIPTYIRVRKLMTIKTMFPIDLVFLVLDVYFVVAGFDFETKELHPLYSEKILTRDQTDRPDLIFTAHIPTEPLPKRFIASYSVDGVFMHFDFDLDLSFSEGHGLSGTLTMKASDFIMDVSCDILDSIFLNDGYTVGLLIRDTETKVISVRTYDIEPTQSSLIPGSILGTTSDTTTSLFASSPINGGIITIGIQEVNYFKLSGNIKSSFSTADLPKEDMSQFRIVKECLSLESNLFLCGDVFARWFLIKAEKNQLGEVKKLIRVELGDFGEFECCSKLSKVQRDHYLLAYDVFVGMTKTDAQLVTVVPTNPVGYRLNSYAKYNSFYATNAVINGPESEKRTVVGCSERNNSLSILNNGVNVTEYAWFEQNNVKATWAVKKHLDDEYHSFLVFSFVGQTRVLRAGKEVTEVTIKTIRPDVETLYIGNAGHGFIVHVTTQGIALLNSSFKIVHEWNVLDGVLSAAAACLSKVTVSQGSTLYTFSIEQYGLVLQSSTVLSDDIAFVIYDLRNDIGQAVFVALWRSNEVLCLSLPSLQQQSMIQLPAEVLIRCLALQNTNLVIGLGDGRVLHYVYDPMTHALTKGTTFRVGTTQARCASIDVPEINRSFFFVCTDKPSLIVDDVFGLRVVPVNVQVPIWYVCPFKFEYIKGWALVACNDNEVKVISVENVDKLPTKFDLKEFIPCDIDHSSLNSFYSVICSRNGGAYILLIDIDQSVYHPQNQYQFLIDNDAEPLCICNLKMTSPSTGQPTDYLGAVTRTLEISTLSLYQIKRNGDGIFNVVEFQSAQFENRVLSMKCYKGMAILCCPESLILVNFNADGDLDFVADYDGLVYHHVATDPQSGLIVPLGLSTELEFFKIDLDNKTVIIRQLDMDQGVGYKCIDIPLKVAFLNGEHKQVVAGTMQGRLQFFFGPSSNKKDRKVDFYLSDAISSMNTMGEGSVMYTTQSGAVGVCKLISKEDSEVLSEIQRRLSERLKMLVPISHDEIRFNYSAIEDEEYVPQASLKTNLIDGDFVMKYLTLQTEQKQQIEKEMNMNVTDYIQQFHQGLRFC